MNGPRAFMFRIWRFQNEAKLALASQSLDVTNKMTWEMRLRRSS